MWNVICRKVAILSRSPWANWGFSVIFRNVNDAWVGYIANQQSYSFNWTDGSLFEIEFGIFRGRHPVWISIMASQISVDTTGYQKIKSTGSGTFLRENAYQNNDIIFIRFWNKKMKLGTNIIKLDFKLLPIFFDATKSTEKYTREIDADFAQNDM